MKKSIRINGILIILMTAFFMLSCNKDDDDDDDNNIPVITQGTMTIVIDGASYTVTSFKNTYSQAQQAGMTGYILRLEATISIGKFVVSLSNWDWQNPPTNGLLEKTYDVGGSKDNSDCIYPDPSTSYCDAGDLSLTIGWEFYVAEDTYDAPSTSYIVVTSNNATEKRISGNFTGRLVNFYDDEDDKTVSGTFTNLYYNVSN